MYLTENETLVYRYLEKELDEHIPTIAYSELESALPIHSKQLRGIISSLLKKKLITHDFEKDAGVSFIGLR